MIKLSIITPTYNRYELLKKNIESIKNQKFKNIEHIIVDNLSNDGTEDLIINYKNNSDYSVNYIREPDKGIYYAMNKGIKAATGEWVHILNSDDIYYSAESLNDIFKADYNEYDVIVNAIVIGEDIKSNNTIWIPQYNEKIRHHRFPHPGLIIKKDFYNKNGLYNENYKIVSDSLFITQHIPKAKIIINNKPLIFMNTNEGISSKKSVRHYYERVISILFYHRFPVLFKIKEAIKCIFELIQFLIKGK